MMSTSGVTLNKNASMLCRRPFQQPRVLVTRKAGSRRRVRVAGPHGMLRRLPADIGRES